MNFYKLYETQFYISIYFQIPWKFPFMVCYMEVVASMKNYIFYVFTTSWKWKNSLLSTYLLCLIIFGTALMDTQDTDLYCFCSSFYVWSNQFWLGYFSVSHRFIFENIDIKTICSDWRHTVFLLPGFVDTKSKHHTLFILILIQNIKQNEIDKKVLIILLL